MTDGKSDLTKHINDFIKSWKDEPVSDQIPLGEQYSMSTLNGIYYHPFDQIRHTDFESLSYNPHYNNVDSYDHKRGCYRINGSIGQYEDICYVCETCLGSGCSDCNYHPPEKVKVRSYNEKIERMDYGVSIRNKI